MKAVLRIGEAAHLIGVSTKTIRRWDKAGKISCFRTIGNHRRIKFIEVQRITTGKDIYDSDSKPAIYARVSSHEQKQKGDLMRQIEVIKDFCTSHDYTTPLIFQDVGSGLNTKRKSFLTLCTAIEKGEVNKILLTYPDRLTRFGFKYLERYFKSHGAEIQILNSSQELSLEQELVQDLIAIITSFSGRVHGLRSARARKRKSGQKMVKNITKCQVHGKRTNIAND